MTAKELIEYLSGFDPDENVSVLILDLKQRLAYKAGGCQLMTDAGFPVLLFELGESDSMDDMVEESEDNDHERKS